MPSWAPWATAPAVSQPSSSGSAASAGGGAVPATPPRCYRRALAEARRGPPGPMRLPPPAAVAQDADGLLLAVRPPPFLLRCAAAVTWSAGRLPCCAPPPSGRRCAVRRGPPGPAGAAAVAGCRRGKGLCPPSAPHSRGGARPRLRSLPSSPLSWVDAALLALCASLSAAAAPIWARRRGAEPPLLSPLRAAAVTWGAGRLPCCVPYALRPALRCEAGPSWPVRVRLLRPPLRRRAAPSFRLPAEGGPRLLEPGLMPSWTLWPTAPEASRPGSSGSPGLCPRSRLRCCLGW